MSICPNCQKYFKYNSQYKKHEKRKTPCKKQTNQNDVIQQSNINEHKNDILTKPFLKWVGGKTQIIDTILNHFPNSINNYYEPFLGGGSILFGLLSKIKNGNIIVRGKIIVNDINTNLINLYKNIKNDVNQVIQEITKIIDTYHNCKQEYIIRNPSTIEEALTSQESYYYWIRKQFNKLTRQERQTPYASAMVLFLNKTCFRGVYREGPNGFNVPFGHYKNPSIFDIEHIKMISTLIKNVEFQNKPFQEILDKVQNIDDFVYLDPPYAPEKEKSFVSYTINGFDEQNHICLFKNCNQLQQKNIKFLLSNSDVKMVRDYFPDTIYKTDVIICKRSIHSKKPQSKTNEVLIYVL